MEFYRVIPLAVALVIFATGASESCQFKEDELIGRLLKNYEKQAKPPKPQKATEVNFGMSLMDISDYDLQKNKITIDVWENFKWTDKRLTWNETEAGGIESIRLSPDSIWIPDIVPYNGWATQRDRTNVVIYSSGKCSWVPRFVYNYGCYRDEATATCSIKYGSWTYDGTKLNLTSRADSVDTSTYRVSSEYKLVSRNASRSVLTYECCPEPYIDITFDIIVGFNS